MRVASRRASPPDHHPEQTQASNSCERDAAVPDALTHQESRHPPQARRGDARGSEESMAASAAIVAAAFVPVSQSAPSPPVQVVKEVARLAALPQHPPDMPQ